MKKHILGFTVGVITFASSIMLLPTVARQVGKLEARFDLLRGERRVKRCIDVCVEPGALREWESTLAREFQTEMVVVPPCLMNEADHQRVRGYNIRQLEELERVYGKDRVEEEARKSSQRAWGKPEAGQK